MVDRMVGFLKLEMVLRLHVTLRRLLSMSHDTVLNGRHLKGEHIP